MAGNDLEYGIELLGKAVAREATGIAVPSEGEPDMRRRVMRALLALERDGLAEVVRAAGGVVGAEFTYAGYLRGKAIAAKSASPVRVPGDVENVVVHYKRLGR